VSQSVRQGTVTPTSYIVVEDSTGLKPDHIQRLTYKMTHLYYNWPVSDFKIKSNFLKSELFFFQIYPTGFSIGLLGKDGQEKGLV